MPDPISLITGGVTLASGLYDAFTPNQLPDWLKEEIKFYEGRRGGASPQERAEFSQAMMPRISRSVTAKQHQKAAMGASRGRSGSTYGAQEVLDVPSAGEIYNPLELSYSEGIRRDAEARLAELHGLQYNYEGQGEARQAGGFGVAGEGFMDILESFGGDSVPDGVDLGGGVQTGDANPNSRIGNGSRFGFNIDPDEDMDLSALYKYFDEHRQYDI